MEKVWILDMTRKPLIAVLCAVVLLSACSSMSNTSSSDKALSYGSSDDASVKISEAASSVSRSIQDLARVQAAATPPHKGKKLPDPEASGLTGIASIDWSGPIGPLVEKLAKSQQFKVRVLGKAPAIPVIVTVTAKNTPIASILRDVDYQAGNKRRIWSDLHN